VATNRSSTASFRAVLAANLGRATPSAGAQAVQAPVALGSASTFGVLAGSTVTNTGASTVNGDLGLSPGTSVTGFPPGTVTGTTHAGDAAAAQAQNDLTTAYNDAAGRTVGAITVSGNLGGQTLTPGLYKSTSTLAISSGDLTLDAQGDANAVFIFQVGSSLTTTSGRRVILSGGAKAANIFWQVGSSATLGTTSVFKGNILAQTSITVTTGAVVDGRLLARTGQVSLDASVVGTAGTTFDIGPANPLTIVSTSGAGSTVTVPITLSQFAAPLPAGNGAKGFTVTVAITSGLKFSPNLTQSINPGTYLTSIDANPVFNASLNTDGSVAITAALNPGLCQTTTTGSFPNGGVVFTIVLGTTLLSGNSTERITLVPAPQGAVTPTPTLKDCNNNASLAVTYGVTDAPISVQLCGPVGPPTNLTATPVKSGNGNTPPGIAGIRLDWQIPNGTPSSATVDIWRAPFGFEKPALTWVNPYPEYDDDNLFIAQAPTTPTGTGQVSTLGWTKLPSNPLASALTFTDKPPARGFWYYIMKFTDPCNLSVLSNMTTGTLDYLLGDVSGVNGVGDNTVNAADASALGFAYGSTPTAANAYLDFGPTETHTPDGIPHPDDFIGFEDLIIYSMNFNKGPSPQLAAVPAAADRDELAIDAPPTAQAGETFTVALRMRGAGDLRGVSTQLGWDAAVAEPVSVQRGGMVESQDGVMFSAGPGSVDVALLGRDRPGLSGEGVLATVTFRAKAAGDPHVGIASVDARDVSNQKMNLQSHAPSTPITTAFAPASPNPYKRTSTFGFSLSKAGPTELAIFSVDGRRVKTLVGGVRGVGAYRVAWDGTDDTGRPVQSGLFFARLVTLEGRFTRTVVRVK
jgi:hypothetical protein